METKKRQRATLTLIEALDKILEHAKGSQLKAPFYRKVKRYTNYIAERLELSPEESVVLALFVNNSQSRAIQFSDFQGYLDCRMTQMFGLLNAVDTLVEREYIYRSTRHKEVHYRMPSEFIDAIRRDEVYTLPATIGLTLVELFSAFKRLFELIDNGELEWYDLKERVMDILAENTQLAFCRDLLDLELSTYDTLLFVFMAHRLVNLGDAQISIRHDLDDIFPETYELVSVVNSLKQGYSGLVVHGLVAFCFEDGFANKEEWSLTALAKQSFLSELSYMDAEDIIKSKDIIQSESINSKTLYYPLEVEEQVSNLERLLRDENYQAVRARLRAEGYRTGFTCLLYGQPGTGKTETVLQIARRTGRDLIQVNISEIKSKWVGESEQNIKKVFDSYRTLVAKRPLAPILLFNEADAIINMRQEQANSAVDKMENSIQDIILQEMESLEGILIATTNLATNLDKAFERRFLYKIEFSKPTLETRMAIWREMLPSLPKAEVRELAEAYPFTGGQIENIARHYTIDSILYGADGNILARLHKHCRTEVLNRKSMGKIGF